MDTTGHGRRVSTLFLFVGTVVGLLLVVLIPPFASPDEATHFFRAYQLSEGRVFAERSGDRVGGRLPSSVERDVHTVDTPGPPPSWSTIRDVLDRRTGGGRIFVDFQNTALYPPLTYGPQAIAIAAGRLLGLSNLALFYLARLADLAVFLALVAWACSRFPRAPWLPAAVGLLPATMFLAASASPDGLMVGLCTVVIVEALAADRPRRLLLLCLWLGLAKPPYFVVGLLCLVVWWWRGRAREAWHLPAAAALAVLPAAAWSRWADHLFVPYQPYIHRLVVDVQPGDQLAHLVTHPWRFVDALVATAAADWPIWLGQVLAPWGRGIHTSTPVAVAAGLVLLTVLVLAPRRDPRPDDRRVAITLAGLALVTAVATIVAVYLYSNAVDPDRIRLVFGRYLLPVLVPLLVWVPQPSAVRRSVAAHAAAVDVALAGAMGAVLVATLFVVA